MTPDVRMLSSREFYGEFLGPSVSSGAFSPLPRSSILITGYERDGTDSQQKYFRLPGLKDRFSPFLDEARGVPSSRQDLLIPPPLPLLNLVHAQLLLEA